MSASRKTNERRKKDKRLRDHHAMQYFDEVKLPRFNVKAGKCSFHGDFQNKRDYDEDFITHNATRCICIADFKHR